MRRQLLQPSSNQPGRGIRGGAASAAVPAAAAPAAGSAAAAAAGSADAAAAGVDGCAAAVSAASRAVL